jgi:hypothetical protein
MAKDRQTNDGTDREKPSWVALAEANRHTRRPIKKGFYLSEDAARRLETAGLVERLDQSLILDALLRTVLVGYYSGVRRGKESGDAEPGQAA